MVSTSSPSVSTRSQTALTPRRFIMLSPLVTVLRKILTSFSTTTGGFFYLGFSSPGEARSLSM